MYRVNRKKTLTNTLGGVYDKWEDTPWGYEKDLKNRNGDRKQR